MSQKTSDKILVQAKINFTLKGGAFLSTIFYSMETQYSDEIDTACTDGTHILINKEFFSKLSKDERVFLLAHETMHVALMHTVRLGDRDPELWNIAGDYIINAELKKSSDLGKMPADGLFDQKYAGMTTEQVYDVLMKKCQKQGKKQQQQGNCKQCQGGSNSNGGNGNQDQNQQGNSDSSSGLKDVFGKDVRQTAGGNDGKEQIQQTIIRAVETARMVGEKSAAGLNCAEIKELIKNILEPKIDWKSHLQDYLCQLVREGYSFTHRNKHYPSVYLPGRLSKNACNQSVKIYIDVSGSVSSEEITEYLAEISGIRDILNPELINIIPFDTRLHAPIEIYREDEFPSELPIEGRGGTDIKPVFKDCEDTDLVFTFTDGMFWEDAKPPRDDIIWVIIDNPNFDYVGKVIYADRATKKC